MDKQSPSRVVFYAAVAVIAAVHLVLTMRAGVVMAPDALTFSRWADRLIQFHFDYGRLYASFRSLNVPPVLYFVYVTIVALAKLAVPSSWPAAIAVLNWICDVATARLVLRFVRAATRSTLGVVAAAVLYLAAFDVVLWVRYPMTDIPFLAVSAAAFFYLPTKFLERGAVSRADVARAIALALITLPFRPVGFLWVLIIGTAAAFLAREDGPARFPRVLLTAVLPVAVVILLAHTFVVAYPERWPFQALSTSVKWDAEHYRTGEVVRQREETYHRPPTSFVGYTAVSLDRFAHFFAITAAAFSRGHKLYALAYYLPLYALALIAIVAALRRRTGLGPAAELSILLAGFAVFVVAFWHSLAIIDFDWRYRLPAMPYLIALAACGVVTVAGLRRSKVPASVFTD